MTEKRLSHAYMLVGPDDPARAVTATELAASLLCREPDAPCRRCRDCRKAFGGVHPDIIMVERRTDDKGRLRREILVDQIREVTADAVVAPNEAERKVYVIREADRLNTAAQNALLKMLEEPPGHVCFILCTTAADALLPTVRSRCTRADDTRRERELPPLSQTAEVFLRLTAAGDEAELTRFCLMRGQLGREEADALLEELDAALSDILCRRRPDGGLSQARAVHVLALIAEARGYMARNISVKQVFGLLAAETLR